MPLLVLISVVALASFDAVREEYGCVVSMRPEGAPDGAAMRAECVWPDVDPHVLAAVIGDLDGYERWVWPVAESEVRRLDGGRALVWQRQQVFGLADREVLLWATREELPGGVRLSWEAAVDEPLVVAPGAIRTPRNQGYWEVVPGAEGGSRVVHEIAVDPGGSVPRWLVAMTRARGFTRVLADARRAGLGG